MTIFVTSASVQTSELMSLEIFPFLPLNLRFWRAFFFETVTHSSSFLVLVVFDPLKVVELLKDFH